MSVTHKMQPEQLWMMDDTAAEKYTDTGPTANGTVTARDTIVATA